jgi:hypothetical protein
MRGHDARHGVTYNIWLDYGVMLSVTACNASIAEETLPMASRPIGCSYGATIRGFGICTRRRSCISAPTARLVRTGSDLIPGTRLRRASTAAVWCVMARAAKCRSLSRAVRSAALLSLRPEPESDAGRRCGLARPATCHSRSELTRCSVPPPAGNGPIANGWRSLPPPRRPETAAAGRESVALHPCASPTTEAEACPPRRSRTDVARCPSRTIRSFLVVQGHPRLAK